MRTQRDDLLEEIVKVLSHAYGDGGLTAEQEYRENYYNAEEILSTVWKHLEPFVIDNRGNMIFEFGMLKHTLEG